MSFVKKIDIIKTPTPEVAGQFLKVANDVAVKYTQDSYWSTQRSWNAFESCTDLYYDHPALFIYNELRAELFHQEDELCRGYATTVELMVSTQAAAEEWHHAIVALCSDSLAIVIDHALYPTAFRVPLGGVFEMHPYIPISGPEGQERFKYLLEDGTYKLTLDSKHASYKAFQFFGLDGHRKMSLLAAIIKMSHDEDMRNGALPTSKHLSFRSLLDKKPQFIAAEPVDDKWLATTVRIRVDFAEPHIVMQIP